MNQKDVVSTLKLAFSDASRLSVGAMAYFTSTAPDHAAYEKWFGGWDWGDGSGWYPGALRGQVIGRTRKIRDALDRWQFIFECDDPYSACPDTPESAKPVAYVDTAQEVEPLTIYACDLLFSRSSSVTDLKGVAGVIVHEVSHFVHDADTNDDGAAALDPNPGMRDPMNVQTIAKTNPPGNADNAFAYQYFIASDPGGVFACGCRAAGRRTGAAAPSALVGMGLCAVLLGRRRRCR